MSTNRTFGFFFGILFLSIATYYWWQSRPVAYPLVALALSFVLIISAQFAPRYLEIPNRLWFKFGQAMGHVVSPIVLAAIYFTLITPLALFMRVMGRDELKLKAKEKPLNSYWVSRHPLGPPPESFRNQY